MSARATSGTGCWQPRSPSAFDQACETQIPWFLPVLDRMRCNWCRLNRRLCRISHPLCMENNMYNESRENIQRSKHSHRGSDDSSAARSHPVPSPRSSAQHTPPSRTGWVRPAHKARVAWTHSAEYRILGHAGVKGHPINLIMLRPHICSAVLYIQ